MNSLIPSLLGLIASLLMALFTWVWKIEKRMTATETVMYGVQNSSSVVGTLKKVSDQMDQHAVLISALVHSFDSIQKEHETWRNAA